jgi:2,4-dienoyl-CoA reductase-like NADH-dependent reductase (Old Yellow Enzyme family)
MHLLRRIERYLRRSGISATRFGRDAINDPRLVHDLRRGRELRPVTEQRIASHIGQREDAAEKSSCQG